MVSDLTDVFASLVLIRTVSTVMLLLAVAANVTSPFWFSMDNV
jgi:hypothetical protein